MNIKRTKKSKNIVIYGPENETIVIAALLGGEADFFFSYSIDEVCEICGNGKAWMKNAPGAGSGPPRASEKWNRAVSIILSDACREYLKKKKDPAHPVAGSIDQDCNMATVAECHETYFQYHKTVDSKS